MSRLFLYLALPLFQSWGLGEAPSLSLSVDGNRNERELTSSAFLPLSFPSLASTRLNRTTIYYSTPTFRIPLTCRARLSAIRHAKENKTTLSSLLALLLSALYGRWKLAQRKVEKEKVRELVGRVLGELRKQVSRLSSVGSFAGGREERERKNAR